MTPTRALNALLHALHANPPRYAPNASKAFNLAPTASLAFHVTSKIANTASRECVLSASLRWNYSSPIKESALKTVEREALVMRTLENANLVSKDA